MKYVDWKIVRFLEKRALDIDPAIHFNPQKYCYDIDKKLQTYKRSRHAKFMMNLHVVFVTKGRCKVLFKEVRDLIEEKIPLIAGKFGWEVYACECMPEHIHMFVSIDNITSLSKCVSRIRYELEEWVVRLFPILRKALEKQLFQRSYFGESIGNSSGLTVFYYLKKQWKNYTCYAEKYKIAKGYCVDKQKKLDLFF